MCYHANSLGAVCVRMCSLEAGAFMGVFSGYPRAVRNQAMSPAAIGGSQPDSHASATACSSPSVTGLVGKIPFI